MIKDPIRVSALLDIVAKVATAHPQFMNLSSEASAELRELNETIRKTHEEENGQPITPAVFPPQSPLTGMENSPDFDTHPAASTPTKKNIDENTPPPPVTIVRRAIPATNFQEPRDEV